jgi:hypothetical protein
MGDEDAQQGLFQRRQPGPQRLDVGNQQVSVKDQHPGRGLDKVRVHPQPGISRAVGVHNWLAHW